MKDSAGIAQLQINKVASGYVITGKDSDIDIGTTHLSSDVEQIKVVGIFGPEASNDVWSALVLATLF